MGDPAERNWFRGSGAHNTVRVNGQDQGKPAGPFRWSSKPSVTIRGWIATSEGGAVDAQCNYEGIVHRRRVLLAGWRLLVLDEIEGPGALQCEQIWQLGPGAARFSFAIVRHPEPARLVVFAGLRAEVAWTLSCRRGIEASLESKSPRLLQPVRIGQYRPSPKPPTEIERVLSDSSGDSSR